MVTVISAAYSAALISSLTSVIDILPFHSLESFVEDGTYQFSVYRGTAYYDKFAVSIIRIYFLLFYTCVQSNKNTKTNNDIYL